jgi:hypothetical protein
MMRWSSMVKVGLSGTSLALAVCSAGCSSGDEATKEPLAVEVAEIAADAKKEASRRAAYEEDAEARAAERRDVEDRLAREERERQLGSLDAAAPNNNPWFLRPAGETQNTASQNNSVENRTSIRETQPVQPKPVVSQPVVKPVQAKPVRDGRPWGIPRAACGRG